MPSNLCDFCQKNFADCGATAPVFASDTEKGLTGKEADAVVACCSFEGFYGPEDDEDECEYCGGTGFSHHDCGEDTCCCLDPEPNRRCEACGGTGYKGGTKKGNYIHNSLQGS